MVRESVQGISPVVRRLFDFAHIRYRVSSRHRR